MANRSTSAVAGRPGPTSARRRPTAKLAIGAPKTKDRSSLIQQSNQAGPAKQTAATPAPERRCCELQLGAGPGQMVSRPCEITPRPAPQQRRSSPHRIQLRRDEEVLIIPRRGTAATKTSG
ncbi:hypothetical protein A3H78_01150 [Candidatus Roizmanbacteria bacterium RIFCSPLOWO2_02_FULL_36_11]|uniref:Uncharacterized protein n=1 Tax=Candidatus Roizmanbacteria bacterium RIFCSPLOWO2_02_FULL_36_11 TaxID=1802071 RepID=A0A1F7JIK6_9BACT|nr:MAG: hypothetical protein A3H78_01150 [Candidatus Roizmanbacteria bacterium RIFCSPLOWO2_02_FULL_36_11]